MRCRSCGQRFDWSRYAQELDEDCEQILASVPCDRL
ncbi:MAG: dual CXXC motif small (seleno)protein [Desulfovermiculus sp.]